VADLLTVDEALRLVLEHVRPLSSERVPTADAAGRILAEPALAAVDLPPFDSSAMDGFAVRAADVPGRLPVRERIAAGRPSPRGLEPGEAMAIATGGAVPAGADAVVPIEYVVDDGNQIEIGEPVEPGASVRPQGGDVRRGEPVLPAGARLQAGRLGALAAAGVAEVVCARRPRAAVLVTGTELRPPGAELEPGQIYEANSAVVTAQLTSAGAEAERLSPVADEPEAHREALERGLEADVLVTTGGVSVGPHDLVRGIGAELGVEEVFWRVAVKPGKPLWFGVRGNTLVFGLPGNPVSVLVSFELFVRPAVLALQGASEPRPRFGVGSLVRAVRRNAARDELLRARSVVSDGGVELDPVTGQESHMIVRAGQANALVAVEAGDGEVAAGTEVPFLALV
jgi:molybdopterin molybdotransferase